MKGKKKIPGNLIFPRSPRLRRRHGRTDGRESVAPRRGDGDGKDGRKTVKKKKEFKKNFAPRGAVVSLAPRCSLLCEARTPPTTPPPSPKTGTDGQEVSGRPHSEMTSSPRWAGPGQQRMMGVAGATLHRGRRGEREGDMQIYANEPWQGRGHVCK